VGDPGRWLGPISCRGRPAARPGRPAGRRALHARPEQCYFWTTHQGAELDLLVVGEGRRRGCEFKRTDAPGVTKCMHVAIHDLGLESIDVVHAGRDTYPLAPKIRALAISRLTTELGRAPLSRATLAHHLAHAAPRAAQGMPTQRPRGRRAALRCRHPMDIVPT